MIAVIVALLIGATVAMAIAKVRLQRPKACCGSMILIPCTADTEKLEMLVRSAYWSEMMENGEYRRRILIVTISAGANAYTAKRLSEELPLVDTADITALTDLVIRSAAGCGEKINKTE